MAGVGEVGSGSDSERTYLQARLEVGFHGFDRNFGQQVCFKAIDPIIALVVEVEVTKQLVAVVDESS